MNRNIRFTILGNPMHKRRHRGAVIMKESSKFRPEGVQLTKKDFRSFSHPDPAGEPAEAYIKLMANLNAPIVLFDEPMFIYLIIYFPIVKSTSKKDRCLMEEFFLTPGKKPDHDNQIKVLCDAFNGIIWKDDKLVDRDFTERYYSDNPRAEILLGPFHDAPGLPKKWLMDCMDSIPGSINRPRPGRRKIRGAVTG